MRDQDQQSRVFYELCALILNILRSAPFPFSHSSPSSAMAPAASPTTAQVSPASFASLLLGVSIALMLCGSVTFFIGFILMPWVLGLLMVFNLIGFVSNLSGLGRAILCPAPSSSSSRKEMPAWNCL
ncbi:PREDICTED: uncharacterized protein LOC104592855 [Nelumbo nucifera]|uniref:Uncharacterized protein LOC104592855 n=2 Tax=Nelumbo nucifera TaxID=4432 RepID=A0A1U7ZPS8_NELNU|nr:PREDICTED: uncharacterized protein LOC104592855 [Nelumbo nucifera]DAD34216.1 TPA_asm: hypothetical protein HUJ06_004856 [Nelumbo nucifera]